MIEDKLIPMSEVKPLLDALNKIHKDNWCFAGLGQTVHVNERMKAGRLAREAFLDFMEKHNDAPNT